MVRQPISVRLRCFARRTFRRRPLAPVIRAVRADALTYLDDEALEDLFDAVTAVEQERRDGILIEAGCALGGSAIVMAMAKAPARPLFIYDVFGMPPPPSAGDGPEVHARYRIIASGASPGIAGNCYYGYLDDLLGRVVEAFRRHGLEPDVAHGVQFVRGMMQETLVGDELVALAHIDCDRYESVKTVLQRVAPRVVRGGVLVIDDYDQWSGCRKAVDEYFCERRADYRFVRKSRLHVIRT